MNVRPIVLLNALGGTVQTIAVNGGVYFLVYGISMCEANDGVDVVLDLANDGVVRVTLSHQQWEDVVEISGLDQQFYLKSLSLTFPNLKPLDDWFDARRTPHLSVLSLPPSARPQSALANYDEHSRVQRRSAVGERLANRLPLETERLASQLLREALRDEPTLWQWTDAQGNTLLHLIARRGWCVAARIIVAAVALEQRAAFVDHANADGRTALHEAAAVGHLPLVTLLVEHHGADVLARSGPQNALPLDVARAAQHEPVTRFLALATELKPHNDSMALLKNEMRAVETSIDERRASIDQMNADLDALTTRRDAAAHSLGELTLDAAALSAETTRVATLSHDITERHRFANAAADAHLQQVPGSQDQ